MDPRNVFSIFRINIPNMTRRSTLYIPVTRPHIHLRSYTLEYYRCISANGIILWRDIMLHRWNRGILGRDERFLGNGGGGFERHRAAYTCIIYGDFRRAECVFPLLKMVGKVTIYLYYIIILLLYIYRIYVGELHFRDTHSVRRITSATRVKTDLLI